MPSRLCQCMHQTLYNSVNEGLAMYENHFHYIRFKHYSVQVKEIYCLRMASLLAVDQGVAT